MRPRCSPAFWTAAYTNSGARVNLIVNHSNFELGRPATPRFLEMVREYGRRYLLSCTRYSTDAVLRRKLGGEFAEAKVSLQIDHSFENAAEASRALFSRSRLAVLS